MADDGTDIPAQRKRWLFRSSSIVQIWLFISMSIICRSGSQGVSSQYMTYSTMETVNETQSINLSDIYMTPTVSSGTNYTSSVLSRENSASISATPRLSSNCHRECVCNHSTESSSYGINTTQIYHMTQSHSMSQSYSMSTLSLDLTSSDVSMNPTPSSVNMSYTAMDYNMSESSSYGINMTQIYNMTQSHSMSQSYSMSTLSFDWTSSDVRMNPTSSSVNMSYTASVNATTANYSSSVWPTPSSSVSEPFVCSNQSCWWEVKCSSYAPRSTLTVSPSINPSRSLVLESSSLAITTESPCQESDCNASETKAEKDYTGAIVGGVLGGLAFVVLVVLGIWWCSKKKAKNTGRISPESPPLNQTSHC